MSFCEITTSHKDHEQMEMEFTLSDVQGFGSFFGSFSSWSLVCFPPGSGLLSQYGNHAQRREAPQRDDRSSAKKGACQICSEMTQV